MDAEVGYSAPITSCCLHLARDYLALPNSLHRWCVATVTSIIAILVACFITYAFVEKHHLEDSYFYGRLQFSFVDGGYAEIFGYMLELAACAIFVGCARLYRKKHWYMWAAILCVVFLDDAFRAHEIIGSTFGASLGLSPVGGDLIGFASTGLLSAAFWLAGWRMIAERGELCAYLVFTFYFSVLIFLGVGVDAVHGLLGTTVSQTLFTLIEDGGELLMCAVISLSSLGLLLRQQQSTVANDLPAAPAFSKS